MNNCMFLAKAAVQNRERLAVVHGEESLTYAQLYERALSLGGNLRALGLQPGDRVAFVLPNSPRVLEVIYGCFAAGLVVVPINARLHPREIGYIVGNAGARVLIASREHADGLAREAEALAGVERFTVDDEAVGAGVRSYDDLLAGERALSAPVDVEPTAPSWLFYTSGTTGRPKGATWSHRTVTAMLMNYLADVHNIQPGEVVLHAAPLSHGSGIVAMPSIARGATNVILETPSFEPDAFFALIERWRVSHVAFLAPTQIVRITDEHVPGRFDLSSLRAICYGGAPIYVEHLRRAIETFGPVFTQIYGQGEAPITLTGMSAARHAELLASDDARLGSAGTVRTDVEVRIAGEDGRTLPAGEPGEVVARGDVVMLGYWNDPDATAQTLRDGWLHTGDVGAFDEDGYLFLLDRQKDVIISGGNNVYPREVEEVIAAHPAVATVVVLGIPDDYWGEAVHAVIVRNAGAELDERGVIDHCAQSLGGYKKPKSVEFVDELPVSGYGKVLRTALRERYWAGRERRVGGGSRVGR
jgi:acyl-CoA synthetase (AMP-forming)/AMP-acid ligase II